MADADKKTLISKLLSDPDAGGVKKTKRTPKSAKVSFAAAMDELGYTSVFDIVRESKGTFVKRLAARTDADGDLAYDNAQCYAAQIARSWREHQVSSDRRQITTARTGIRSLVDVGPSFPNLFKENWDQFCKVGAIAAVDSPVAYLNSLYSFLQREIESQGGPGAIPLSVRRPDIPSLVLDAQSTFTPVPMLKLVTEVLSKGIQEYLDAADHPDKDTPVHELLKTKRHPFTFPYDFHHQQIMLGLSGKKQPKLGELNYRASPFLPIYGNEGNQDYGAILSPDIPSFNAQCLLSGLSAEQQSLITSRSLFSTFNLCKADIESNWRASTCHLFLPWGQAVNLKGFIVPNQDGVVGVVPLAIELGGNASGNNTVSLAAGIEVDITYTAHDDLTKSHMKINCKRSIADCLNILFCAPPSPVWPADARDNFFVVFTAVDPVDGIGARRHIVSQSFSISIMEDMPDDYLLTEAQAHYFFEHFGLVVASCRTNALTQVKTFLAQTGLVAVQLSEILSCHEHRPKFSPNVLRSKEWKALPCSMNYGACYVNGTGGWEVGAQPVVRTQMSDASMGIEVDRSASNGSVTSYLTNTSLNRFDRLQRMIRLQRWMNIPFAELDTLIMAVIHSEGESNLTWELNGNTLRALGVYRYLSNRYAIGPEEFAAFMHFLTAFASGDRMPLFDKVFNSPALFDTPLILDGATFSAVDPDADSQKTIAQLCVGLGIAATDDEFGQMARDTALLLGPPDAGGKPVTVELMRTQAFISSFYRQARLAQLFGLSFKDSRALIDLLGGQAYLKRVVSGYVRGIGEAPEHSDVLDILMQMDWAVGWLVETRRDVGTLRAQLWLDEDSAPTTQALLDQLNQMGKDLVDVLLTREQMDALNLPNATQGTTAEAFDWWTDALSATDIRDGSGLVRTVPSDKLEDPATYLAGNINAHLSGITFSGEVDQQALLERVQAQLLGFVMGGRTAQLRLFEGLFQSLFGLSMDRTELVMRLAGTGGCASMLSALVPLTASGASLSFPLSSSAMAFVEKIQSVVRCVEVVQSLGLSASALLTFSSHPSWLWRDTQELRLTLMTLYGLDRYGQWVKQAQFPEERLLDYFRAANAAGADASKCADSLAQLIGWSAGEVKVVTASLNGVAKSMADVDWVRRVQATCEQSGLSAATVLQATQLNPESPSQDWQAVGEAAMATNR